MAQPMHATAPAAPWPRRLAAEAFGTFALVVVAVGGDAAASVTGDTVNAAARAVAPALIVAAMIYAIGDGSGAHFNPVVTMAFAIKRLLPIGWVLPYWGAQLSGGLAAAGVVRLALGDALAAGISRPRVDPGAAVVIEAVLTLLLLTVILGTADRYRIVGPDAALAVGATIAACGLIALPIEGASMNPARSLAPAIVGGDVSSVGIYILGPVIGAALAVGFTRFLHGRTEEDPATAEAAQGSA